MIVPFKRHVYEAIVCAFGPLGVGSDKGTIFLWKCIFNWRAVW